MNSIAKNKRAVSLLPVDQADDLGAINTGQNAVEFFNEHFGRDAALLTINGRAAIAAIMESLQLTRSDEVCILTTFDLPNVSSCVTSTIFNYCKPSRVMSPATRTVLVIHEFGVPYVDMPALVKECRRREIPLIEDCAHTINSQREHQRVGAFGDWVICSLPKIFPVRLGGVLLGKRIDERFTEEARKGGSEAAQDVLPFLDDLAALSVKRRLAFRTLTEHAKRVNLEPLFRINDEITPWLFPLQVGDATTVMEAASRGGIECGRWHGTNIVVFPCNQYLDQDDLERIGAVFETASRKEKR